jgi:hypothetical protein
MEPTSRVVFADLDRDAAALIALWTQIHGGDPPPEPVEISPAAAMIATAMVAQLRSELKPRTAPLSAEELAVRLSRLGLELQLSERLVCVKGPEGEPGCCVSIGNFPRFHLSHPPREDPCQFWRVQLETVDQSDFLTEAEYRKALKYFENMLEECVKQNG